MTEQNSSFLELELDDMTSGILKEAAKWSRYVVVAFYICCGLMLFAVFGLFMAGDTFTRAFEDTVGGFAGSIGLVMITVFLLVVTVIIGILAYLLGKFSSRVKQGILENNQRMIAEGVAGLKNYLTITAVFGVLSVLASFFQLFVLLGR